METKETLHVETAGVSHGVDRDLSQTEAIDKWENPLNGNLHHQGYEPLRQTDIQTDR